jgi:hypothetical protein
MALGFWDIGGDQGKRRRKDEVDDGEAREGEERKKKRGEKI